MKEFVEKLIKRLEELKEDSINENCPVVPNSEDCEMEHSCASCFLNASIKIVKQLVEGYNPPKSRGLENGWIPCSERLPETDKYILLSFENFSIPAVGRYEEDEEGGAFFIGDDDGSCSSYGLFVNAWQPLPKPYKPEQQKEMPTDHFTERFNRVV